MLIISIVVYFLLIFDFSAKLKYQITTFQTVGFIVFSYCILHHHILMSSDIFTFSPRSKTEKSASKRFLYHMAGVCVDIVVVCTDE